MDSLPFVRRLCERARHTCRINGMHTEYVRLCVCREHFKRSSDFPSHFTQTIHSMLDVGACMHAMHVLSVVFSIGLPDALRIFVFNCSVAAFLPVNSAR